MRGTTAPSRERRFGGIALKISSLVVLLLSAAVVVVAWTVDAAGEEGRNVALLVFVGSAFLGGLAMVLVLDALVTRPLVSLARQVRRLQNEGYARPVVASGRDEPLELGLAVEALRLTVVAQQAELVEWNDALERLVSERTDALALVQASLVRAEKLASVGLLAGGVAHEVNNPNTVILARTTHLISIADEEGLDPDVIEDLEVVKHQAQRIQRITGDLLQFARRSELKIEQVDLSTVVTLTASLVAPLAKLGGVRLTTEVMAGAVVEGNRGALEQVCFNLLKNAIDATPSGGSVRIEGGLSADGQTCSLTFDDSGDGVPEALRAKLFDPFFTTKAVGEGTGLGLSIVHGILEELGGGVEIDSSPLGGARFAVRLPVASVTRGSGQ